jgi:hypothetical protein
MKVHKTYFLFAGLYLIFFLPFKGFSQPPTNGDWIITGEEILENQTITLNGNLIVENGGSLALTNINLIINNTYKGQYLIEAKPGSSLAIYNSEIHPCNLEYGFRIIVENASFELVCSDLRGFGYRGVLYNPFALFLNNVQSALILNNVIEHMSGAISLINVLDSEVSDNIITASGEEAGGFSFQDCHNNVIVNNAMTGSGHYVGIMFDKSTGNYVANNDLWPGPTGHLGHGVCLDYGSNNNIFESNTIRGPTG